MLKRLATKPRLREIFSKNSVTFVLCTCGYFSIISAANFFMIKFTISNRRLVEMSTCILRAPIFENTWCLITQVIPSFCFSNSSSLYLSADSTLLTDSQAVDWRSLHEDENGALCVVRSLKSGEEDGAAYAFIRDAFTCATSVKTANCWSEEEKCYGVLEGDGGWSDPDDGGDTEVGDES